MYAAPIADASGPAAGGAVLVASDTSDISHTLSGILGVVVALSGVGVVLLAGGLAAALLTRREVRPLRRAGPRRLGRSSAQPIPHGGCPSRPPGMRSPQLTGVLNRMLASLEADSGRGNGAFWPMPRTSCAHR